jgi:integrase
MRTISLTPTRHGFSVRIRCGKGQNPRFTIKLHDEPAARVRALRMGELARVLVAAGRTAEAPVALKRAAETATEADFESITAAIRKLCGSASINGKPVVAEVTFKELAERWTSGKLAKEFPDHVKSKVTSDVDEQRLRVLYPVIGSVPLREFTVQHAKQAMAAVPEGRRPATRRHYAQLINRVLGLAVWPCELIAHNPLPKGFLPRSGKRPAFSCLRPAEDARLLGCTLVPLEYRLLYGVLAREGMRLSEALGLRWRHLDLEHGAVRLDVNKTGEPRVWALRDDVARVLARLGKDQDGKDRDPDACVLQRGSDKHAKRFRAWLKTAGVNRPELFERTPTRRPIRVHDLRATFITIGLASGKSEAWICDRTGHKSSQMVNAYRRAAQTANELGLGELSALDECVPELAAEPQGEPRVFQSDSAGGSDESVTTRKDSGKPSGSKGTRTLDLRIKRTVRNSDPQENTDGTPQADACEGLSMPVEASPAQGGCATDEPLERLSRALEAAALAGEWDIVRRLAATLEGLKAPATGKAVVVSLDSRRGKGGPR